MSQAYQPGLSHHFYKFRSVVYLIGDIVTLSINRLFVCLFVCLLAYNGSVTVLRTGRTTGISSMRILVALAAVL